MSLGVLNNLSALYAANNLNNTNNSLNKTLQQLSSGSKINSGADDAAGLSLVLGLQANQQALSQSQTNATEGVGLLQVADGALSQVTSLLNRAVTLATEAANGTLNSTQDMAANQEYQSILSEISNIGSTTTYNQKQVFNSVTNVYTGDSSTQGASVTSLNIRSLSSSNLGDSGGAMSYSSGQNNVFMNLSTSSANAALTDTLNGSGTTTLNVNYLVQGGNGTANTATAQITVGQGSNYGNTVNGLISAINDSGLGLTATFATQANAGVQGAGSQTGIEITGGLVSAGVTPGSASTSGTLDLSGLAAGATLALGATVTIGQGSSSHAFTIDQTNNTLNTLQTAINNYTTANPSFAVAASVVTNGDGTQSLSLADSGTTGGALSVTTTAGAAQAPAFAAGTTGTTVSVQTQGTQIASNQYIASVASSIVVGASGTNASTDTLTLGSSITIRNTIPNNQQDLTFVIGEGTNVVGAHASTIYTGSAAGADTLAGLATAINAQNSTLGLYATVGSTGLTLTSGSWNSGTSTGTPTTLTGENVTVQSSNLTSSSTATQLSVYSPQVAGQSLSAGTAAVTVLDNGNVAAATGDTLTGSISLTNSSGSYTFTAGAGTDTANTFFLGNYGGSTYTGLIAAITAKSSTLGYGAAWNATAGSGNGAVVLTGNQNGINPITVTGTNTLADTTHAGSVVADAGGTGATNGTDHIVATSSTAILQLASGNIDDANAVLGGALSLTFNGHSQVFIMGNAPSDVNTLVAGAIYTGGTSAASLVSAINSAGTLGITASAPTGGTGGIYLQGGQGIAQTINMNAVTPNLMTPLGVTSGLSSGSAVTGVTGAVGNNAVDNLTATNNSSVATAVNTNDAMSGGIWVVNGTTTDKFVIGSGSNTAVSGTYYTNNTDNLGTNYGNTLAGLASLISAQSATLGVTAQANAGGLTLTQTGTTGTYTGAALSTSNNTLVDVTQGTFSSATTTNQLASQSDTLSGALVFNVGSGANQTVTMAQVTAAHFASTVQGLVSYINANQGTLGVGASWVPNTTGNTSFGNIKLTSGTEGPSGTVNVSSMLTSLTDTTTGAALSYTANSDYNVGLSSTGTNKVFDTTAGQTAGAAASFFANTRAGSGVATISYSDGAGQSLSATDLTSQSGAQSALNAINAAISNVAAQDGYIGAMINTLNSVSQVLATQSENVQSAQNAVQATDYASAASNMSKYQILSQTGIAALAQANSMQQEVLKLLQ